MLLVLNKLVSESLQDDGCTILVKATLYYTPCATDTPRSQETGVLPSSRGLATVHCWYSSRGPLSRSVSRGKPVCFRVPPGTASNGRESFFQNVASGVMIEVQNHTTAMTDVRTNTQRLLHDGGTNGAFLT